MPRRGRPVEVGERHGDEVAPVATQRTNECSSCTEQEPAAGIGEDGHVRTSHSAHREDACCVDQRVVADLHLQAFVSLSEPPGRLCRSVVRRSPLDRSIERRRLGSVAAEKLPQRHAREPRSEVPTGHVDPGLRVLMTDTLVTQRSIEQLHTLGVRLSIDDFGTGYSSLAYLHRFPVDELKIDRSFISDLTTSTHPAPLVSAMVAMGKALGLEIVAEGVETPEQAAQLRALGCDQAQGYLFARPQHAGAIAALLQRVPVST